MPTASTQTSGASNTSGSGAGTDPPHQDRE